MKSLFFKCLFWGFPVYILLFYFTAGCKKENSVKFPKGIFPDSVFALTGINSEYDDYNINVCTISGVCPVIFSSNRASNGGQFDLVQGVISFDFNKETGSFLLNSEITNDVYYAAIIGKANTPVNDFGPYGYFSSNDGYEYLIVASAIAENGLDFFYVRNLPRFENIVPNVAGPFPVTRINTPYNEAYITFDFNGDSIYFCSDRDGNYDIYVQARNKAITTDLYFNSSFDPAVKVDSINSIYSDMAPFIYLNIMVFSSNRPGGMGGYDLYYSVQMNGKWSSPVNLGPEINTSGNEFRPVIIYHNDFTNQAIIFSSDRPGGSGNIDLYFTGFSLPVTRIIY
ncbi:MAG: hypothetical protein ACUVTX_01515 [Bacteroidales bacterium]